MNILPIIDPILTIAIRSELFFAYICKHKNTFDSFDEMKDHIDNYKKNHPILSKLFKILYKFSKIFYDLYHFLEKVNYFLFPVGNVVKSKLLPNEQMPFNVKYLYINFKMLEDHVAEYGNYQYTENDWKNKKELWQNRQAFDDVVELSSEIADLLAWWNIRKEKEFYWQEIDVKNRIEEDKMLIRLNKIRHKMYWGN